MRKIVTLMLTLALLCPFSASAAEAPKYMALSFEGLPPGPEGRALLEGLAARDVHATFYLWAAPWEQGQRILDGDHEIGLLVPSSLNRMSRRQVAARLRGVRALLPPCRVRCLMAEGNPSDGLRQVAGALKLTFPPPPLERRGPMGSTFLEQAETGDILHFRPEDVDTALLRIDLLRSRGFRLVTVSELDRLRRSGMI
jgi:hypothetical protein